MYMPTHMTIQMSIHMPMHMSMHMSIHPCLYTYLHTCLLGFDYLMLAESMALCGECGLEPLLVDERKQCDTEPRHFVSVDVNLSPPPHRGMG